MSDIRTVWVVERSRGGWVLDGPSLQSGNDLATAVLISLFSDRAANPDDVIPDRSNDPRGWWGDDDPLHPLGSRLWLIYRSNETQDTLEKAKDYCNEALQWMVDDLVVARFAVTCEWTRPSMLGIQVVAYKQDGTFVAFNFDWAWNRVL